jgi:uncharacterized membrane protein
MITGYVVLVLLPYRREPSIWKSVLVGACYGGVMYGVYALTMYSIISAWPLQLVLVDILWGTTLYGLVGGIGAYMMSTL